MSVLTRAANTTIHNGKFVAVSNTTTVTNTATRHDIVALLHSHSATAGLLDARERFDAPKCDEGTRTSMILEMKKFVQDGDEASPPGLYWLYGPAGVGKSALAQSLSLSLKSEGDHAASFFFSRTSSGRNNGNQVIVTLAYQVATNLPALRRFMSKAVRNNPAVFTASNATQMQSLIIDPINTWRKKYNWSICRWIDRITNAKVYPRLILLDGLDECKDPNVQTDLIICIASAVRQLSIPLRFVIASRPEAHILAAFELDRAFQGPDGVTVMKKNLGDDEDADEQIATFLLKEFAEIRRVHPVRDFLPQQWPHPNQIMQLVSKSSKGFIYPATVIRYIKMPHNRPDKCLERILGLSEIPTFDKPYEPLDLLYRYIFESVPEPNKSSVHDIFHFLVLPSTWAGVTRDPTVIESHFGFPPGHVQHVLRDLLCLVEFTSDWRTIKVLHASLPDFLLDKARSGPLYIHPRDAHATVAASYLLDMCHQDDIRFREDFPHFLDHLLDANMSNTFLVQRIIQMDLLTQFEAVCCRAENSKPRFVPPPVSASEVHPAGLERRKRPHDNDIEAIAFLIAYLLVLVIQRGSRKYIRRQTAALKAFIVQRYPLAASAHGQYAIVGIIPTMTSFFRDWRSTIYHECIIRIFAQEVAISQNDLREAIFEVLFLTMAYLHRDELRSHSRPVDYTGMAHRMDEQTREPHFWANIVVGGAHTFDDESPSNFSLEYI